MHNALLGLGHLLLLCFCPTSSCKAVALANHLIEGSPAVFAWCAFVMQSLKDTWHRSWPRKLWRCFLTCKLVEQLSQHFKDAPQRIVRKNWSMSLVPNKSGDGFWTNFNHSVSIKTPLHTDFMANILNMEHFWWRILCNKLKRTSNNLYKTCWNKSDQWEGGENGMGAGVP